MTKDWKKFTVEKNLYVFDQKLQFTVRYLSLGLHKGSPS
jgi:hypothetical protein